MVSPTLREVLIVGAGPAGLTAAWELSRNDVDCVVLEREPAVGGLSRTCEYKGYLFDIGGHRFYTKSDLVNRIWHEVLGPDLLSRPRLSRIYYDSKFIRYPLEPLEAITKLGIREGVRCAASFLRAQLAPIHPESDFESWVVNRFGRRLFEIFFKSYTEKVWGIPCNQIGAEWAAQRIRGLSVRSIIRHAFGPRRSGEVKTLIGRFEYPRRGPGMMWERMAEVVCERGAGIELDTSVERICWRPGAITGIVAGGREWIADHYISSMPVRELLERLDPAPPDEVRQAAADFNYRDFLTVALIVRVPELFPDNWIYVHDGRVRVGRIQNYKNWSPEMVPDADTTCLGLEYFCNEGGELWSMSDSDLIELGKRELAAIGLVDPRDVADGTVLRVHKAYPVYDGSYRRGLRVVREFLKSVPNLQLVGRNGMHHYNNQDHSMLTGILAARNVLGLRYDVWQVNQDPAYLEEWSDPSAGVLGKVAETQPAVPRPVALPAEEM